MILGIGGVKMLRSLGYQDIRTFHLNEGHAALLTLELLDEAAKRAGREWVIQEDVEAVRNQCVFTTHTPVPAGHDKFPVELARKVIGPREDFFGLEGILYEGNILNMTSLALNLSRYINGVAKKHGEVTRLMFAGYPIEAITNGVHAATWVSEPFRRLFDRYIPLWRRDNFSQGKGEDRDHSLDVSLLYDNLEHTIVPLFYRDRERFVNIMICPNFILHTFT